jgi:hypothetical protein
MMNTFLNFSLELTMSFVVFGLLAKWYFWPYVSTLPFTQGVLILLLPFLFRHLGLMSLVPGVVDPELTQTTFAWYQAYGDFIAMILALISFILVHKRWKYALAVVWLFNIVGTLDHLNAMVLGTLSDIGAQLHAFWYIPVIVVPLDMILHFLIFVLLIERSREYSI